MSTSLIKSLASTLFSHLHACIIYVFQELAVSRGRHSLALQGIIVHLELCSPPSTSVLWGHGVVKVDWKLRESVARAHRAGTVWPVLERRQVVAALDTIVLKVHECEMLKYCG